MFCLSGWHKIGKIKKLLIFRLQGVVRKLFLHFNAININLEDNNSVSTDIFIEKLYGYKEYSEIGNG